MVGPALEGDYDGYQFSIANAAKDMGYFCEVAEDLHHCRRSPRRPGRSRRRGQARLRRPQRQPPDRSARGRRGTDMKLLNPAITGIEEEGAFAVLDRALALAAEGKPVINLGIGQPDFSPPPHVLEAAAKAARDGPHGYTSPVGIAALREAVAARVATALQPRGRRRPGGHRAGRQGHDLFRVYAVRRAEARRFSIPIRAFRPIARRSGQRAPGSSPIPSAKSTISASTPRKSCRSSRPKSRLHHPQQPGQPHRRRGGARRTAEARRRSRRSSAGDDPVRRDLRRTRVRRRAVRKPARVSRTQRAHHPARRLVEDLSP